MKKTAENKNDYDLYFGLESFTDGRASRAWRHFGAHPRQVDGQEGYFFRVWAPHACKVCVFGDFNSWDPRATPLNRLEGGIWEGFVPGLVRYDAYQYAVWSSDEKYIGKADPYAFHAETRPGVSSKIYDLSGYEWGDAAWLKYRRDHQPYRRPMNIYEVHLGSWRRNGEGQFLSYRDTAQWLVPYVKEMGYTHVELMPLGEHPLDDSWGYQCTGYFAATSRFGTPHDLMYLIDQLHQAGVGVILDWVPAHFPRDAFGLYHFDGTPTYEYPDPRKGEHADWGTNVFDFGRPEVRSFLFSSAMFWLEVYHVDGLRVDAVSSMLYLDYGRKDGEWIANKYGGNGNLEAVEFLQKLNEHIFGQHPDVLMIAEESTAWPKVTYPTSEGGLGFNYKWNMGWMNDILHYIKMDPYFRQFNHKDITFSLMYAFSENYILPLSHDEVVHMKGSLINKMPGTDEEKFAGVRAFYTYMLTHPGKKLTIMGTEFGQFNEWHFEQSLDWHLVEQQERHQQLQRYFKAANAFYLEQPPLWDQDDNWKGFQWLVADDAQANTVVFLRWASSGKFLLVACNFSPVHRKGYWVGVPTAGTYQLVFSSDAAEFGGAGLGDSAPLKSKPNPCHGQEQAIEIDLPPMSSVIYQCTRKNPVRRVKKALEAAPQEVPAQEAAPSKGGRRTPKKKP